MANSNYGIRICQLAFLFVMVGKTEVSVAQQDSLILKNGNIITGEVKLFEKGVLNVKTPYSKTDFVVKWAGVKAFYSRRAFLIEIEDGQRANGTLEFVSDDQKIIITEPGGHRLETSLDKVVFLKPLKYNFWSHVKFGADIGLSLAKANNLNSLTINTNLGYLAEKWQSDAYYNVSTSSQDSAATTKRTDANVNFKYYLKNKWFISSSLGFLSNTEQALHLRTVSKLGASKFLIHTNRTYWGVGTGLSLNIENFTNETQPRNSLEAYLGTEFNRFAVGNLSFQNSLFVYPSLTEAKRWRSDLRIDSKYDLKAKFYIKLGLTVNYDNQPAIEGNETDYLFTFSIGWKL